MRNVIKKIVLKIVQNEFFSFLKPKINPYNANVLGNVQISIDKYNNHCLYPEHFVN